MKKLLQYQTISDEPVTKTNVNSKGASGNSEGKGPKKSEADIDDVIAPANKKLGSSENSVKKGPKKFSASDADDVIAQANAKLSTFDFDN